MVVAAAVLVVRAWCRRVFFFFEKKVCRVVFGHSATSLPSVRQKTLGKLAFAVKGFAECRLPSVTLGTECRLPSVTLGKPFAECFWGFAECPRHSAKLLDPVVHVVVNNCN